MFRLTILDVGHGNCAVLRDDYGTVVIDGGKQQVLLRYLKAQAIAEIEAVLISHADHDHIGGIIDLLLAREIRVNSLYLNADASKQTRRWNDLRHAAAERSRSEEMRLSLQLTVDFPGVFDRGDVKIEILSPTPVTALAGPGEQDIDGSRVTSNSMSAVLRISASGVGQVLLAGDMEGTTLQDILARNTSLQAKVLIFPHHGGSPGSVDAFEFARRLCREVQPELVVFSIGRGNFDNPRPEVVAGVKAAVPDAHIACTQLSEHCATNLPSFCPTHLHTRHAHGYENKKCCAGSIEISLGLNLSYLPGTHDHLDFIRMHAPTALCQQLPIVPTPNNV